MRFRWVLSAALAAAILAPQAPLPAAPEEALDFPAVDPGSEDEELVIPADQSLREALTPGARRVRPTADGPCDQSKHGCGAPPTPHADHRCSKHKADQYCVQDGVRGGDIRYATCHNGGPSWTASAEVVFLERHEVDSVPLVSSGGTTIFRASDIDFDFEPGVRASLTRHGRHLDFELSYLQVDAWNATAAAGPAGSQFAGYGITLAVDPYTFQYDHDLYSAEANWRRTCFNGLDVLAGFRYAEINERFVVSSAALAGAVDANADNRLYGFQLGAVANLWSDCTGFSVDGVIKAGVYHNNAEYRAVRGLTGDVVNSRDDHTAFLGELAVNARYQVTDLLALRGGYQMMWVEGAALAPNQSSTTDLVAQTAQIGVGDSLFYHGGFFGVEVAW